MCKHEYDMNYLHLRKKCSTLAEHVFDLCSRQLLNWVSETKSYIIVWHNTCLLLLVFWFKILFCYVCTFIQFWIQSIRFYCKFRKYYLTDPPSFKLFVVEWLICKCIARAPYEQSKTTVFAVVWQNISYKFNEIWPLSPSKLQTL